MFQHVLGKLGGKPFVPIEEKKMNRIIGTSPIEMVREVGPIIPIKTEIDTLDDIIQALGYHKEHDVIGRGEQAVVTSVGTHNDKEIVLRIKRKFVNNEYSTFGSFIETHNILKTIYLHGGKVPNSIAVGAIKDITDKIYPFQIQEKIGTGANLANLIKKHGRLPPELAVAYALELTGTVRMIDLAGYIHRDLKPANILCNENGDVYLTDFGLKRAKTNLLSKEDLRAGTPSYMAPEYFDSRADFEITDRHALAVILYEMCSGKTPFSSQAKDINTMVNEIYHKARLGEPKPIAEALIKKGENAKLAYRLDEFFLKAFKDRHSSIFELHSDISRLYLDFVHPYKNQIVGLKKELYDSMIEKRPTNFKNKGAVEKEKYVIPPTVIINRRNIYR